MKVHCGQKGCVVDIGEEGTKMPDLCPTCGHPFIRGKAVSLVGENGPAKLKPVTDAQRPSDLKVTELPEQVV